MEQDGTPEGQRKALKEKVYRYDMELEIKWPFDATIFLVVVFGSFVLVNMIFGAAVLFVVIALLSGAVAVVFFEVVHWFSKKKGDE